MFQICENKLAINLKCKFWVFNILLDVALVLVQCGRRGDSECAQSSSCSRLLLNVSTGSINKHGGKMLILDASSCQVCLHLPKQCL